MCNGYENSFLFPVLPDVGLVADGDLKEKEMSRGEFENVSRALGGWQALVNPNAKDKQTLALLDALVDWQKEDKLFENQQLFRTPIVRNGRQATVGYQPDVWKNWE